MVVVEQELGRKSRSGGMREWPREVSVKHALYWVATCTRHLGLSTDLLIPTLRTRSCTTQRANTMGPHESPLSPHCWGREKGKGLKEKGEGGKLLAGERSRL
jgi:hypothetical protein